MCFETGEDPAVLEEEGAEFEVTAAFGGLPWQELGVGEAVGDAPSPARR